MGGFSSKPCLISGRKYVDVILSRSLYNWWIILTTWGRGRVVSWMRNSKMGLMFILAICAHCFASSWLTAKIIQTSPQKVSGCSVFHHFASRSSYFGFVWVTSPFRPGCGWHQLMPMILQPLHDLTNGWLCLTWIYAKFRQSWLGQWW